MPPETITATPSTLLWLIPAFPLLGFLINGLLGRRQKEVPAGIIACLAMAGAFVVSLMAFLQILGLPIEARTLTQTLFTWLRVGDFQADIAFQVDQLSAIMILVVSGVGFLIHVYSIGYMKRDPGVVRYFTQLNLFAFFMLMLVMADNYLLMFLGWEGVGLCSYLLIGFWYEDVNNAAAGMKAFVVNRIGDFGFLLGMLLIFTTFGSLQFSTVFERAAASGVGSGLITAMTLLLFVGATGKSAQIPLYVWLPDAMAGPTPVSALIHAATMVTAGVYMVARSNLLFTLAPVSLAVVAGIGAATAIFAASIGLVQTDIKKVLAYSTVSQLGYMFLACGVGAFGAGIFHLMTHAFFKALLFLGAGSVIHAMHHYYHETGSHANAQDMNNMGGLKAWLPTTFATMLIATLAIAGIPGLSGFFSKDEIFWQAFAHGNYAVWAIGLVAAGMTAFYMFRLIYLTFYGEFRSAKQGLHPHESPKVMTIPLIILGVLSVIGGWLGIPHVLGGGNQFESWLEPVFARSHHLAEATMAEGGSAEVSLMVVATLVALSGLGLAYLFYRKNTALPAKVAAGAGPIYDLVYNKYYVDELYAATVIKPVREGSRLFLWKIFDIHIVDGAVNGTAWLMGQVGQRVRRLQTGLVSNYALVFGVAVIIVILAFVL